MWPGGESPGPLGQHAVSAVPQVPGEPDGAWASLEQVIKVIHRRRDVWANTDGEGGARGLEPWTWVDSSVVYV